MEARLREPPQVACCVPAKALRASRDLGEVTRDSESLGGGFSKCRGVLCWFLQKVPVFELKAPVTWRTTPLPPTEKASKPESTVHEPMARRAPVYLDTQGMQSTCVLGVVEECR